MKNKRGFETPSSSSKHEPQPQKDSSNAAKRNSSRSQFSQLCSTLTSIIPPQHFHNSLDTLSQADQIEQATNYIVELRERVENLNKRRDQLMVNQEGTSNTTENKSSNDHYFCKPDKYYFTLIPKFLLLLPITIQASSPSLPSEARNEELDAAIEGMNSQTLNNRQITDTLSQADQIEQATNYIVGLRERVENLNQRRDQLMVNQEGTSNTENLSCNDTTMMTNNSGLIPTSIEVKDLGSVIEVQIVVQRDCEIKLHEVIRVLEEEGAEVVDATFSTHGNYVLHTLHARVTFFFFFLIFYLC
ncbi:uncharacterized protein LOC110700864 [Chenopodium quinoa]|uniref:uncharacterized protein LOC110700864 n=1 Tax=Chenopodium quinoa TaxID=63459 RepID=UPI000B794276|nr:uncharacterized protein LOC110700864 [Chenopodium quinoa]